MRVDDVGGAPRVLGVDLGGDEHRGVAERAGVEDRRDLADDPLVEQPRDRGHRLLLGDPGLRGDVLVGARGDRELALHQVEQALVEVGERDRGALLAAAQLGTVPRAARRAVLDSVCGPGASHCSHRAASLAW